MTNLKSLLSKLGACKEAVDWCNSKELAEAWETCERPDWMLWLCGNMCGKEGWPTKQEIVFVACLIAEDVLPIYENKYPNDRRVRNCIEVTRKWAKSEATMEEVKNARCTASAAAYAYAADGLSKYKEYSDLIRRELQIPLESR